MRKEEKAGLIGWCEEQNSKGLSLARCWVRSRVSRSHESQSEFELAAAVPFRQQIDRLYPQIGMRVKSIQNSENWKDSHSRAGRDATFGRIGQKQLPAWQFSGSRISALLRRKPFRQRCWLLSVHAPSSLNGGLHIQLQSVPAILSTSHHLPSPQTSFSPLKPLLPRDWSQCGQ